MAYYLGRRWPRFLLNSPKLSAFAFLLRTAYSPDITCFRHT